MRVLKYEQIGRNCFDSTKAIKFPQLQFEIWPGFAVALVKKMSGIFLNVEPCHKIIRYETALDFMTKVADTSESKGLEVESEVTRAFSNITVITKYNNKPYRVSHVAFDLTPRTKVEIQGKEMTLIEYYKEKYNERIKDENQSLLVNVNKRTGESCFLVPELCRMAGISALIKDDFKAMREIKNFSLTDA